MPSLSPKASIAPSTATAPAPEHFTQRHLLLLLALTLIWGVNWPVTKLGVQYFPPLSYRAVSLCMAVPVLALLVRLQGLPLLLPRSHWGAALRLSFFNMIAWNALTVLAIPMLSSGRAAILAYTMPIFSALLGSWLYQQKLGARAWLGVLAAALGVCLLLWHEIISFSGSPLGVALMLLSALSWASGTHQLRRASVPVPLLTLSLWMLGMAAIAMAVLATVFEHDKWLWPNTIAQRTLLFNGIVVLGMAQSIWFFLARSLPPIASTLSVMLIPVLGVFTGAWWLGEALRWQDYSAVVLMMLAIASVLWPSKPQPAQS